MQVYEVPYIISTVLAIFLVVAYLKTNAHTVRELVVADDLLVLGLVGLSYVFVTTLLSHGLTDQIAWFTVFMYAVTILVVCLVFSILVDIVYLFLDHKTRAKAKEKNGRVITMSEYLMLKFAEEMGTVGFKLPPLSYLYQFCSRFKKGKTYFGILADGYGLYVTKAERLKILREMKEKGAEAYDQKQEKDFADAVAAGVMYGVVAHRLLSQGDTTAMADEPPQGLEPEEPHVCGECVYWEKHSHCSHPDMPQGEADYRAKDATACWLFEPDETD